MSAEDPAQIMGPVQVTHKKRRVVVGVTPRGSATWLSANGQKTLTSESHQTTDVIHGIRGRVYVGMYTVRIAYIYLGLQDRTRQISEPISNTVKVYAA